MNRVGSALWSLPILYVGRASGFVVGFLFLPMFGRALGQQSFGAVALILSLQSLALMLDFGVSTVVAREVALESLASQGVRRTLRSAEFLMLLLYAFVLLATVGAVWGLSAPGLRSLSAVLSVVLVWLQVQQNIYYTCLIANREYIGGSVVQVIGVLSRGAISAGVVTYVSPTLDAFLWSQIAVSLIHTGVMRLQVHSKMAGPADIAYISIAQRWSELRGLVVEGRGMAIANASGAAVLQLDKPLVSAFLSIASLPPYYLASTLAMAPLSMLAGPINQYFQPRVLLELSNQSSSTQGREMRRFALSLTVVAGVPTTLLWVFREGIVNLWLSGAGDPASVVRYSEILLPGFLIGALGFVPNAIMIAGRDYRFQGAVSLALAAATLSAVTILAYIGNLTGICVTFAVYHVASTSIWWLRAAALPGMSSTAKESFLSVVKIVLLLSALAAVSASVFR